MTARQAASKFALSAEQWDSLCAILPSLRHIPIARALLDDRITLFRTFCRADNETNAPNSTKDKLLKIEAAAKKLRNELRSLDLREKIALARWAAPDHQPLLLDNVREFWGENSTLFHSLCRVENAVRGATEAMKPKKSGVDAGNRKWFIERLDKDLEYFGIALTNQGAGLDFVCTALAIADPKCKDGSHTVRDYLAKKSDPKDAEAKVGAKDKQERDDSVTPLIT